MDKTTLLRLKEGSTVEFAGVELGYTNGIEITPNLITQELENQKIGKYGLEVLSGTVSVRISIYEWNTNNLELFKILPKSGQLIVYGETFETSDNKRKFTFYNAHRSEIGTIRLGKLPESVNLEFTCYYDETNEKVYNIEITT